MHQLRGLNSCHRDSSLPYIPPLRLSFLAAPWQFKERLAPRRASAFWSASRLARLATRPTLLPASPPPAAAASSDAGLQVRLGRAVSDMAAAASRGCCGRFGARVHRPSTVHCRPPIRRSRPGTSRAGPVLARPRRSESRLACCPCKAMTRMPPSDARAVGLGTCSSRRLQQRRQLPHTPARLAAPALTRPARHRAQRSYPRVGPAKWCADEPMPKLEDGS
jgi:hypothetical protein